MSVVEVAEWEPDATVMGNVAMRRLKFTGRQVLPAHEHNFPHGHLVIRGVIRCTLMKDGDVVSVTDYPAGSFFEIPARLGHQLESLSEDGAEGVCLFAVRDEDAKVVYEPTEKQKSDRFNSDRRGGGDAV